MNIDLLQHGNQTRLDLADGIYSVGGGLDDAVRVAGMPARAVELQIDGSRLVLTGKDALFLEDAVVPAQTPRVLALHERVRLAEGVELRHAGFAAPKPAVGTLALLREMLSESLVTSTGGAAVLVCLSGMDAGIRFPLSDEPTEIGRGETTQVRVRDSAVSRRHARIQRRGESFVIEDLGTPNGVYVNGQRIASPYTLSDDAIIELGRTLLRFRVGVADDAPTTVAPVVDSEFAELQAAEPPAGPNFAEALQSAPGDAAKLLQSEAEIQAAGASLEASTTSGAAASVGPLSPKLELAILVGAGVVALVGLVSALLIL